MIWYFCDCYTAQWRYEIDIAFSHFLFSHLTVLLCHLLRNRLTRSSYPTCHLSLFLNGSPAGCWWILSTALLGGSLPHTVAAVAGTTGLLYMLLQRVLLSCCSHGHIGTWSVGHFVFSCKLVVIALVMSYLCHYYLTYGRYSYSPMLPTSSIFPLSIKPGKGQNTAIGNIMCIFLPSLPPYLPYTTGSSPSSYHSNTGWCCFPSACTRHDTERKILILFM